MASNLIMVKGDTYYIDGAVNIGVIRDPVQRDKCILIDTGMDDDSGKKILKLLNESGMTPSAIINTHSHADHCGGNSIIRSRTGAAIYAPVFDCGIIEYPELEPFYLFSAAPLKELDTKFLKAKPSKVDHVIGFGELNIGNIGLQILSLKGHTPHMIGVASSDGVLFAGDAFFSTEIIEKYGLPYFSDIKETLKTLEYFENLEYHYYIPCHGRLLENPRQTVAANIKVINDTVQLILDSCSASYLDREAIAAGIIEKYGIRLTVPQYYLTISTVSAFLSYMCNDGLLRHEFVDSRLKFTKA